MSLCTLLTRTHFLKDVGFAFVLWWIFDILSMTCVILKRYLYHPIHYTRHTIAMELRKKKKKKHSSIILFSILNLFTSHFPSQSNFNKPNLTRVKHEQICHIEAKDPRLCIVCSWISSKTRVFFYCSQQACNGEEQEGVREGY